MDLRARWPWLLALVACRGDGCRCRGQADDSNPEDTRSETGDDSACEPLVWYADLDKDGYGDPGSPLEACDQPTQSADNDLDCDDSDPASWPGASLLCNDLADNDCDGEPDCDAAEGDAVPDDASAVLTAGEASYLGMGMALIDLDGDGVRDLVLSDPSYESPTEDGVYLVKGPLGGGATVWDAAFAQVLSSRDYYTGGVFQAGDLDDDGYPDLALAQGYEGLDGAWLVYGPFDGEAELRDTPNVYLSVEDTFTGPRNIEPWVGDVLGDDGQPDLFVRTDQNTDGHGTLFALRGPVTEEGDLPEVADSIYGVGDDVNAISEFAIVGDLNADGRADLVADYDRMCASFELPAGSFTVDEFCDAWLSDESSGLGQLFADAGDVDGDGYGDVIASSTNIYDYSVRQSRARIYAGADLTALAPGGTLSEEDGYLAEIDDVQNGDNQLGHGMATPGDLNGDGYSEILVSAPTWATRNDPDEHYGAAFLWYGPLEGSYDPEESADWTITSPVEDAWFGFRVIAAPADAQNNATILISAWPFEGTSTVYQFTPGGF